VEKRDDKGYALDTVVTNSDFKHTRIVATRFQLKAARTAAERYHESHRIRGTDPEDPDETFFEGGDGPIAGIRIWKTEVGGKPGEGELVETPYNYYM
jgi:hypothetical protein